MKKTFLSGLLFLSCTYAICQSGVNFSGDADKTFGLIKNGAFKNGYQYLITFAEVKEAAINVTPNTDYLIFFVYDNSKHPATDFKANLITPDSSLRKKYTARPYDRGQVGVARAQQLQFHTQQFSSGETKPVKLEAIPNAMIYVFYKK
ncbi:MAG: hypothetical protein ACHQET_05690 [Chitinophagales bacterium]